MFVGNAGTPMDIEMCSPSPMNIASLSLSPRRGGATKPPTHNPGNIFAGKNNVDYRWDIPRRASMTDSDDEDIIPSPTRNIKSSKNPFTSKSRPVLTSQKSAPLNQLRPQASNPGLVSKCISAAMESGPGSPKRRLSKIPSAATIQTDGFVGDLMRKPSLKKKGGDDDSLTKMAAKNNIKGRTLVELQQARAGGRPLSALVLPTTGENASPKRAFRERLGLERKSSGDEPVAVWDPERDEMPSPFLARARRIARV